MSYMTCLCTPLQFLLHLILICSRRAALPGQPMWLSRWGGRQSLGSSAAGRQSNKNVKNIASIGIYFIERLVPKQRRAVSLRVIATVRAHERFLDVVARLVSNFPCDLTYLVIPTHKNTS